MSSDPASDSDRYRWGRIEAGLKDAERRLDSHNGSTARIETGIGEIKTEIAVLRTKVALGSAIGGLLGAGVVTLVLRVAGG